MWRVCQPKNSLNFLQCLCICKYVSMYVSVHCHICRLWNYVSCLNGYWRSGSTRCICTSPKWLNLALLGNGRERMPIGLQRSRGDSLSLPLEDGLKSRTSQSEALSGVAAGLVGDIISCLGNGSAVKFLPPGQKASTNSVRHMQSRTTVAKHKKVITKTKDSCSSKLGSPIPHPNFLQICMYSHRLPRKFI